MEITLLLLLLAFLNVGGFYIVLRRIRISAYKERRDGDELRDQLLAFKDIGESIQKLTQQQEEAQALGRSLKDLLQTPKLRGTYGEVILEEMLDKVLPKGIWESQFPISGTEKVDCVVKYRDVVVPIDAKFPRDDYLRYLDSESDERRSLYWKAFEDAVRKQILSIESKYIKPETGTAEFALMFIPSEAIYYETIAETNHMGQPSKLLEYAQEHHVIPVSPNTFYAFLQVVILSIRNVQIYSNVKKIQESLVDLQRSFERFYNKYDEMGKRLNQAAEAYRVGNDHVERYRRRLDSTLGVEGFQLGEPDTRDADSDVSNKLL